MEFLNLNAITLNTATGPPAEFRLLPMGELANDKRQVTVDADGLADVLAMFQERGNELSIDYEHQSMTAGERSGPAPAAGWIGGLEIRDDGLWATNVTWTERATELLNAREYRYFSPSIYTDEAGRVRMIDSPALTNRPASHKLEPLVASQDTEKEIPMPTENQLAPLLVALNLNQSADADAAVSRITELRQAQTELLTLTNTQTIDEAKGVLNAWKDSHEKLPTLEAEKATLAAEIDAGKREALIQTALSKGTLSPAQAAEDGFARTIPLETLEKYLETAPKVVNLNNATPPKNPAQVTLSQAVDEVRQANPNMGMVEVLAQARAKYPHLKGENA